MPIKYIPFFPESIDGQAILNNFTRSKRVLRYRDNGKVYESVKRGMPLYEVELKEKVRDKLSVNKYPGNLVIRGECISACAFLKDKGIKVDLVYIDPPFASGADYAKKIYIRRIPKVAEAIEKAEEKMEDAELEMFEEKMYGDVWNKEAYLNWMYENLLAIKSIMSPRATIYVHLDWHIGHYVKILMDEIFGESNFRNEIIWAYTAASKIRKDFPRKHDTILRYSNSDEYIFNYDAIRIPYAEGSLDRANRNVIGAGGMNFDKIQLNENGKVPEDWWIDIQRATRYPNEPLDYPTQKSRKLLERIILSSSNKGSIVADFFGGSGVTSFMSNKLGRHFIHTDVALNSIQVSRDFLLSNSVDFDVMEIKDGVNLFRNPAQTMDKLATLIPGLQRNIKYNSEDLEEDAQSLSKFWFGSITDSKLGKVPVYVPNLLDHTQKVLDIPIINKILNEELPKLDDVKKVIIYYIDLEDKPVIENFIDENNVTEIVVELKDLKQILDEVVVDDHVEYELNEVSDGYEIEITKFISDRLLRKIDEYNQKKRLNTKTKLYLKTEEEENNSNGNSEEENADENGNGDDNENGNGNGSFREIEISEEGLELIELISLDCTNTEGIWKSESEIKIDKNGYVIRNGEKSKTFWDAKINSSKKPLRMKIRNIAGDEIIINFSGISSTNNDKREVKTTKKEPKTNLKKKPSKTKHNVVNKKKVKLTKSKASKKKVSSTKKSKK